MKKIGWVKLGVTFAGCFLGAGYLSGQEIWKFFGRFGLRGIPGMIAGMVLFFIFGSVIIRLAQMTGILEMDRIVVPQDIPWLHALIAFAEMFFLFGIFVVMSAGSGALAQQTLGISAMLGSGIFCGIVCVVTIFGLGGMVTAFSYAVPVLIIVAVGISMKIALPIDSATFADFAASAEASNWPLAAFTFISYNLFGSVAVLAPMSEMIADRKTVHRGLFFGCCLLFAAAFTLYLALAMSPQAVHEEMPMLALAIGLSDWMGYLYAFLLLLGMFGTTLSCTVAIMEYLRLRFPKTLRYRVAVILGMGVVAFFGSKLGFAYLIGIVYSVFGYLGMATMIAILIHYLRVRSRHLQGSAKG